MPKEYALFVDAESMQGRLRSLHHRLLDPETLLEVAGARGPLGPKVAVADWGVLPDGLSEAFAERGFEVVQVDRRPRGREAGGRRRDVLRDLVDLELLARMVERFLESGDDLAGAIVASGDEAAARAVRLIRERFERPVHVIGVEGAPAADLETAATSYEPLPLRPCEPSDPEGLAKLVLVLEALERRKRFLNFKYIREAVVRKVDLAERSFEGAERLLSDAIACGLLRKIQVEDKYNDGQFFTAYALDRDHAIYRDHGSGEAAPVHEGVEEEAPAIPNLGGKGKNKPSPAEEDLPAAEEAPEPGGERKRRRRRRKRKAERPPEDQAPPPQTAARANAREKKKRRGRNGQHQQDRVGRSYEAPSRFLSDESHEEPVHLEDHEIDEETILAARGDLDPR
ncbi:MAG: NYN domain-containing protein [Planctomycetota bacterium]|nr:MAG: NYN domain-containing protein [Planctomycetota bacterium]